MQWVSNVDPDGGIDIPPELARDLDISPGTVVVMRIENGKLCVVPLKAWESASRLENH